MRQSFAIILLGLLFSSELAGQSDSLVWSAERVRILYPPTDSVFLDSIPVITDALRFYNMQGEPVQIPYELLQKPVAHLKFPEPLTDSLIAEYKVIDLPLNKSFSHKDTSIYLPDHTLIKEQELYATSSGSSSFQPFQGLTSSGSISRGISVGNNQDAVLNSNLNLQLSGSIGPNTEIRASITDNSLPIQSDGYTQQLSEFDRVYIELENPDFGMLRAGDYNMTNVDNYFLRFDKRISGAGVFSSINAGEGEIPLELQGGLARGRFARNRFQAQEGNLGPYKLTGNNGEQFIIIISGSERVYMNGVILKRGQQHDYTIDYNAGEITFTSLRPITKESRIVVEFQYTEQNFIRSIFYGESGFQNDRQQTKINFYSEQDSKNQSLLRDLTDDEKRILSEVGDNLDDAVVSSISPSDFQNDIVLYELVDSAGFDSILVYSTDSTAQLYQASFTFLGANKGNYNLSRNDANGRVFQWIQPVNGIPQGSYEPVRQLVAPNQLQILTITNVSKLGETGLLNADFAVSNNDINLFSDLDKGNDVGVAGKFGFSRTQKLNKGKLSTGLNLEFNQDEFRTIERIRRVEFARDWNLPLNYNSGMILGGVDIGYSRDTSDIQYQFDYLTFDGYTGVKSQVQGYIHNSIDVGFINASWLSTADSVGSTDFLREKGRFAHYITPKFWAGIASEGEWNQRRANGTDTLRRSSYNFLQYSIFTGYGDTTNNFTEIHYLERWDDTAQFGRFQQFSKVSAYGINSRYRTNFNSTITGRINVRNLKIMLPVERDLVRTITTRVNYLQRIFRNSITSNTFYETGGGTEPRRTFSYVEVPAGTGVYTHTDYNNNGIKELNEFEIAPTPDLARYVRVFTPSNQYVRTSIQRFSESLNINAPANWRNTDDFRSTLFRFSTLVNYQLDRKTLLTGNQNEINPFSKIDNDSLIVALNDNFRTTLFFNRTSTKFGINYTYRQTKNHNLLSFGVEQNSARENTADVRYQFFQFWLFKVQGSLLDKSNYSANFTGRNYEIDQVRNLYSISFQPGDALILTSRYQWDQQLSTGENSNELFAQTYGLDLTYNNTDKISAQVSVSYILNEFQGVANSPSGFEMLRELKPGKNGTWQLILQRSIKKNILLSMNYSGRISADNRPIHTGNLEIKAFF